MNSLEKILNQSVDDTINEVKLTFMSDSEKQYVFLLLEGKDDVKSYKKFFVDDITIFRSVGGKNNLKKALDALSAMKRVLAIRDADFFHLNNSGQTFERLFLTDKHDIEMTMLSFDDVLKNIFSEYPVSEDPKNTLADAFKNMEYISYIRWFDSVNRTNLDFKFGIASLVKEGKTKDELLDIINKRSKEKTRPISTEELDVFIEARKTSDYFNLCNGHDVTSYIALLIGDDISREGMEAALRISFQLRHFKETTLYKMIFAWQNKTGCVILRSREDI